MDENVVLLMDCDSATLNHRVMERAAQDHGPVLIVSDSVSRRNDILTQILLEGPGCVDLPILEDMPRNRHERRKLNSNRAR